MRTALGADIMYVREARSKAALCAILEVAESGTLAIVSLVAFNEKAIMSDLKARLEDFYANFTGLLRQVVTVAPREDGTLSISTFGPGRIRRLNSEKTRQRSGVTTASLGLALL